MNILNSALGRYEVVGDIEDADFVIGHSFGTVIETGSANNLLAGFILEHAGQKPIVVDRMLADAFPDGTEAPSLIVEGPITNAVGNGVGTWGTLVEAKKFMECEGLDKPLMVAHARHVGRVVMQARKLGMDPLVPAGLPDKFDAASWQWGTRSPALWIAYELLGAVELRRRRQL